MSADMHTCSYSCQRPACVLAQRDELAKCAEQDAAEIVRLRGELALAAGWHDEAIAPAEAKGDVRDLQYRRGFRDGIRYEADHGLSDSGTPQPAGGEAVGTVMHVPDDDAEPVHIGWHRAIPSVGTKLYTTPPAAQVQAAPQEGAPRWVDDCQGKASYDGALVSVSVRTWPGNYSADNRPSGKIDVLRLGKVVQSIEVSADTETQLRAEIESKVAKLAAHPSACELGAVREALVGLIRAGKRLRNTIVETRGVRGMDEHDVALNAAEAALQHRGDSQEVGRG